METKTFQDRREAGQKIAVRLARYKGQPGVIVLGIPRGGVVVAAEVARALAAPLDVWITRKLGAPDNPELALGAVAGDGTVYLDEELLRELGISRVWIERERVAAQREIARRSELYRQGRPPLEVENRTVLLCDDGVATGSTALVALRALRQRRPAYLVLAVPVGPRQTLDLLARECDELVALAAPAPFYAVGTFYEDFRQVMDDQVIEALAQERD